MSQQPPAKRHKPCSTQPKPSDAELSPSGASASAIAAPSTTLIPRNAIVAALDGIPSVEAVAALDAQLAPLEGAGREELKREQGEFEGKMKRKRD
eukprot:COSAG04_NODE_13016_length_623_cov_2.425573_2_plen_94_part_01